MMHPLPFAAENTLADSAPVLAFADHEFPPLVPDDGWQLVADDEKDAFVVRQEEDWGCIVEGCSPPYARVAQQATELPQPAAPSINKHPAPAARATTPSTTATGVLEYDETADDLFVQYKSSSSYHRRRCRPVHGYCKKQAIHQQQQPEATSSKRPKQRAGTQKHTARA